MVSFLTFYGLQFAIWFDVHSSSFAAAFLMWFIYFLDQKKSRAAILFFLLAVTSKENIALYTLTISLLYLIRRRTKLVLFFTISSILYLLFIYLVYFPHIVNVNYLYANREGLLSNLNPIYLFNTKEKLITIFYSFLSFGFLPILNPLTLPLIFAHFTTFFVIASDLPGAQGLFGHYRVTLDPLFTWATVITISTFKFFNKRYVAVYLIFCALFVQYTLHLPLSYLSKGWFWFENPAVLSINKLITYLPANASVASQNNITPHISHRDKIYTLYPTTKTFVSNSPCGVTVCKWLTWYAYPDFVIVETSNSWDIRHLLANRSDYVEGLKNIEKAGVLTKVRQVGNAVLYKVNVSPR
jgi:uncharacterized membrane protein